MATTVSNPLTLVMPIKSKEDFSALKATIGQLQGLPPDKNPISIALTKLSMVHFARFVFLDEGHLAVITSYDDAFEDYIEAFVLAIGDVFDSLLTHIKDAPPTPVANNVKAFIAFVKQHDLACEPPFYSAYPTLRVLDILTLARNQ